jgi:hypothetical protein
MPGIKNAPICRGAQGAVLWSGIKLDCLDFFDAFYGADGGALGGVVVAHALNTGGGVNDVDGGIFGDGVGGAFGQAGTASDAIIVNFHCHGISLLKELNNKVSAVILR